MRSLDARSIRLRHMIVDALENGGHIGASMSLVEILRTLYDNILRHRADEPRWVDRDRCILSKGHGCLALYAILADHGYFPREELRRFCRPGALLGGHPEYGVPGVEASTGSLGQGLSYGLGMALAARAQGRDSRVFVVLGDGESQEGSVREAGRCAGKHRLYNLHALIDYNKIQSAGRVEDIQPLEPMAKEWQSWGWETFEIDGHDVEQIRFTVQTQIDNHARGSPTVYICHTVKGRGIRFAENDPKWHHRASMLPEVIEAMRDSLRKQEVGFA